MEQKICPICNQEIAKYPAISRKDNITEICSECGMKEAMGEFREYINNTIETILVRKVNTKDEIIEDTKKLIFKIDSRPEEYYIVKRIELNKDEYEYFKQNLLTDYDFIKENKDLCKGDNQVLLIKEKGTDDETGIAVDPQGSNYARYSGVTVRKADIKEALIIKEQNVKEELEKELNKIIERAAKYGYEIRVEKKNI